VKWLSLLQQVPWSDVLANTPKVMDSARKLWDSTRAKPAEPDEVPAEREVVATVVMPPVDDPLQNVLQALEDRIDQLGHENATLREQMQATSGLVKALAEQNGQLVLRLDAQGRRLRWLTLGLVAVGLLLVAAFAGWGWSALA
jgi:hypothetical protein